ncbi:ATP-binding protein [Streptomyces marianii]|uniref:ATP-binding protein n=1 Tax=Streptomyces marianii TaxID=1817406 RepID=A0A5R9DS88_9ACTN|nr:ATP-binding protein [Streptomyces marianii]TLQ39369.1 ATP-binding protein [Streptomyces marianii]
MNVHDSAVDLYQPANATLAARSLQGPNVAEAVMAQAPGRISPTSLEWRPFEKVVVVSADPAAVPQARRQLHRLMCNFGLALVADDLTLGAQELMANAVTHGCRGQAAREFTLKASCLRGRVRIEVQDPSPDLPLPRSASDDCEGGRGLVLVNEVATRWGSKPGPGQGKTVWMELDAADEEAAS